SLKCSNAVGGVCGYGRGLYYIAEHLHRSSQQTLNRQQSIMASKRVLRRFSLDSSSYPLEYSAAAVTSKNIMRRSSESRGFQSPEEGYTQMLQLLENNSSASCRSSTIREDSSDRSEGNVLLQNGLRQQSRIFHKLFPEIPNHEELEHVFSCALQKEVIYHGKMFMTRQHLCFHSTVLLKETRVVIPMSSVQSVKKKHTAKIVPNALEVTTGNGSKYLFVSLLNRDACFKSLQTFSPQLQEAIGSRKSSTENTPDLEIDCISFQSSFDENSENHSFHFSESTLNNSKTIQSEGLNESTLLNTSRKISQGPPELHGTVSWFSGLWIRPTAGDSRSLNYVLLCYLLLALLLLLSSGYLSLRLVALEQQMRILAALSDGTNSEQ
ncbi:hypothetical protein DNTS_012310, partial [Danionella cerebrum]